MVKFPFLKPRETPAAPEVIDVEKQTLEAMEAIEREVQTSEQGEEAERPEKAEEVPGVLQPVMTPSVSTASVQAADPLSQKIESILEEDLTDLYLSLPSKDQQMFKQKGEETVSRIRVLMATTKVNAKKIFELIREWLKLIPGVNRFFLEQEAKIKTDKILFTKEHE